MKIAIVGAGAMGASVGAFLHEAGAEVWFIDPFRAHMEEIRENGLRLIDVHGEESAAKIYRIHAVTSADQMNDQMDYIFYQVKGMYMDDAIKGAKCISDEHTCHLTLQNGVGNVEKLLAFYAKDKVFYGMVSAGAKMLAPGSVERNFDPQKSFIAIGSASKVITDEMKGLKELFDRTPCPFQLVDDIDPIIWKKMISNCTGNAICSVARLTLGRLYNNDDGVELSERIEEEVRAVAKAQGIDIPATPSMKGKFPPEFPHVPSTAQDIIARRQTEIDTLNGAVVRLGEQYGVPTPYNKAVTLMVKLIQANYDNLLL